MTETVSTRYYHDRRIACLQFSFCERNTFTLSRVRCLVQELERVTAERSVRCIVFASGRQGYFSDGFSLREMFGAKTRTELENNQSPRYDEVVRLYRKLIETKVPTFVFVDGICRGGGLEWALSCDFITATNNASFALHEARLGIVPGLGGLGLLRMRAGSPVALYHLYSGEELAATEASDVGIVDKIAHDLDEAVEGFVWPIARRPKSGLCRTKAHTGVQQRKLEALGESRKPFLDSLRWRLLREKGRGSAERGNHASS